MSRRHKRNKPATPNVAPATPNVATSDGFANLTARLGYGADNVLSDSTYIIDTLTKNRLRLEVMYRTSWIVGMAVDTVAEDMTREGITMSGDIEPDQIQHMQRALTSKNIWGELLNLIKWGRLYGGAVAEIIIDGQDSATPLRTETVGKGQFVGLRIYDRWQLQPDETDLLEDGPSAGLPASYTVVSDMASGRLSNIRLHHSRVIRYIGIQLPYYQALLENYWGESVIERLHDRLLAFDATTTGAANLISRAYLRTVQIDKLRETLAAGGQAEQNLLKMFHHMRLLQTNEGLTLLDKEDGFMAHSYSFGGLSDMMLQFGQQISGALGIPLVRLFGQSPVGLSATGESDLRMYYDSISAQQEARLREGMLTILRVLYRSMFGDKPPDNFDFDFVPLWQTSQREKIDMAASVATTISGLYERGLLDEATALQELKQASEYTDIFDNIMQEKIEEARLKPPPVPKLPAAISAPAPLEPQKKITDRIKRWLRG